MDTPQAVIDAAFARSAKNTRGKLAQDSSELLRVVQQSLRYWWAVGCRLNWPYFGDEADVAPDVSGDPPAAIEQWTRPAAAEAVAMILMPEVAGERAPVAVIPLDESLDDGRPALYRIGVVYRRATGATEPRVQTLRFFYARRAPMPATLATPFDATWPREYSDLFAIDVAGYLATKDGRPEELPGLGEERQRVADAFRMFLEHEQMNVEQRHWNKRLPAIAPVHPMFEDPGEKRR